MFCKENLPLMTKDSKLSKKYDAIKEVDLVLGNKEKLISNVWNNLNFNKLPYIFGVDAENNFVNFLNQLNNNSFPNKEIINFYRLSIKYISININIF